MIRKLAIAGIVLTAGLGSPAEAQSVEQRIVDALARQGYSSITVSRTLLGRGLIRAENGDGRREIVFNRQNGVILRDYYLLRNDDDDRGLLDFLNGSGSSGRDDDEDDDENDDDDDDEDDDEEDDNGGNSGKGGGGDDDEDDD